MNKLVVREHIAGCINSETVFGKRYNNIDLSVCIRLLLHKIAAVCARSQMSAVYLAGRVFPPADYNGRFRSARTIIGSTGIVVVRTTLVNPRRIIIRPRRSRQVRPSFAFYIKNYFISGAYKPGRHSDGAPDAVQARIDAS